MDVQLGRREVCGGNKALDSCHFNGKPCHILYKAQLRMNGIGVLFESSRPRATRATNHNLLADSSVKETSTVVLSWVHYIMPTIV